MANGINKQTLQTGGGGGGSGTVTSVSVTTANGVSGSVANSTTTPAISITLGAITPTSVVASGNVTGSNLSGINTGDNAVNTLYSGLAASKQDTLTLTTTGTSGAATLVGATLNIPQYSGGGGGSITKGIAEIDFGANTQEKEIATVTVTDASISSTSYPSVSPYAIATTDHDPDDYSVEGVSAMITNIVNGVSFDIVATSRNLTWGKYKFIYHY